MSSEKSSEININYLDKNGNKLDTKTDMKRQSSDTDFHYNMIANQEKIINLKESESSTDLLNINSSTSTETSKKSNSSKRSSLSSKKRIENLDFTPEMPKSQSTSFIPLNKQESKQDNKQENKSIPSLQPTTYTLNPQEVRMKKIELLRRLSEIKSKGYSLTKEYDFNSSIEEMEYEYGLLKSFADKRNGTKLYKSILLNGISLLEFVNDKYDPFDFQLNGWSEHMSVEIDSYEDIIEEIYEKYKSTGKTTPPEIRLIFLILASGAAFHFSKTQLGGIPGVSSMATGALGKMMTKEKKDSQYMSPQEMNLEKQKQMLREKEREIKLKQKNSSINNDTLKRLFANQQMKNVSEQQNMKQQMPPMNTQMPPMNTQMPPMNTQMPPMNAQMPPMNAQMPPMNTQMPPTNLPNMNPPAIPQFTSATRNLPEIRAPENVQDILNRIKTIQENNNINTTETQDETTTNNDRLVSESTYSDNKKRGGRKPKKPVISIDTL